MTRVLEKSAKKKYGYMKDVFLKQCPTLPFPQFSRELWSHPGRKALRDLYLENFASVMKIQTNAMKRTTGAWLTLDHTFKVCNTITVINLMLPFIISNNF